MLGSARILWPEIVPDGAQSEVRRFWLLVLTVRLLGRGLGMVLCGWKV